MDASPVTSSAPPADAEASALVAACRAIDPEPIASLALELLHLWTPPGHETAMAERLVEALGEAGVEARLDEEFAGSPSVVAEFGPGDGPTIQWHGHLDAIVTEHEPAHRDGDMLVGRGAADMKAALAAMVEAARVLVRHGRPRRGRVLITWHGLHESGGNEPLHRLIERGVHGDAAIIGELGSGVELPLGGLGLTFWRATVSGTGASLHETVHDPADPDPLEAARLLLERLVALRARLAADPGEQPKPSLFIGRFQAGDYPNRVATSATLEGTRRHDERMRLPDVAAELRAVAAEVERETGARIEMEVNSIAEAYRLDPSERVVTALTDAHRALTGGELRLTRARPVGNAVHFVEEAGIPAVYYGPDYRTAHSDRETVSVPDLARLAGGFALASVAFCEGSAW